MRVAARILSAVLAATPLAAAALDLGKIGPTYPIAEPSFLEFIEARLREKERSGEIQRLQGEAQARAIAAINTPPPVSGVKPTETARTHYYDPSFTLEANLHDDKGHVLFPAGTRKNPLEVVSLSKHLLFFDARDAKQLERARALIDHYEGKVKPILVAGSYMDLMKRWQIRVYYDQQGSLTRRLGITQVPALVSQEGLRLRIDELAL